MKLLLIAKFLNFSVTAFCQLVAQKNLKLSS